LSRSRVDMSEEDEDTITQELNEALRQIHELSNAVNVQGTNVSVDAAGLIDQKRTLEEELALARSEIASLRSQSNDQAQARDYHPPQIVESRDSMDDASYKRREGTELRSVKRNLAESESKILSLSNNNDMLAAKIEMLTTKLEGLESDKRESEFKNTGLVEKNKEFEQLLDQAMADLQTVSDVNEDLANTLEQVSIDKEEAMAKVRELAADLANNDRSSGKYFEKVEQLTEDNKDLTLQLNEAIAENRGKIEQLSELRRQVADSRSKSKECDNELKALRAELETRSQAEGADASLVAELSNKLSEMGEISETQTQELISSHNQMKRLREERDKAVEEVRKMKDYPTVHRKIDRASFEAGAKMAKGREAKARHEVETRLGEAESRAKTEAEARAQAENAREEAENRANAESEAHIKAESDKDAALERAIEAENAAAHAQAAKDELSSQSSEQIKDLRQRITELQDQIDELEDEHDDCKEKLAEANAQLEKISAESNEAIIESTQLKKGADEIECQSEEKESLILQLEEAFEKIRELEELQPTTMPSFTISKDDAETYLQEQVDKLNKENDQLSYEMEEALDKVKEHREEIETLKDLNQDLTNQMAKLAEENDSTNLKIDQSEEIGRVRSEMSVSFQTELENLKRDHVVEVERIKIEASNERDDMERLHAASLVSAVDNLKKEYEAKVNDAQLTFQERLKKAHSTSDDGEASELTGEEGESVGDLEKQLTMIAAENGDRGATEDKEHAVALALVSELKDTLEEMNESMERLVEEKKKLESDLEDAAKLLAADGILEKKMEEISAENDQLCADIELVTIDKDEALTRVSKLEVSLKEMEDSAEQLREQKEKIKSDLEQALKDCEEKDTRLQQLQSEIDILAENYPSGDLDEQLEKLSEKNAELSSQIDLVTIDKDKALQIIEKLKETLQTMKEEKEDIETSLEAALGDCEVMNARVNLLQSENDALIEKVEELEKAHEKEATSKDLLKELREENERLAEKFETAIKEKNSALENVKSLRRQSHERSSDIALVTSEINRVNEKLNENEAASKDLLNEVSRLALELDEKDVELNKARRRASDVALISSERNLAQRKLQQNKLECDALKTQLKDSQRKEEIANRTISNLLEFEKEASNLKEENEKLIAERDEAKEREEEKHQTICNLLGDQEEAKQEVKRLELLNVVLKSEVSDLSEKNSDLKLQVEDFETEKKRLDAALSDLQEIAKELEQLSCDKENLINEVQNTSKEKDDANKTVQNLRKEVATSATEMRLLESAKKILEGNIENMKETINSLESKLEASELKEEETAMKIEDLKTMLEKTQSEADNAVEEKRNTERLLFKATVESESVACELADCKSKLSAITSKTSEVLSKHESAISIIEEYERQTGELNRAVAELKVLNRQLEFEQQKCLHDLSYTRTELTTLQNKRRRGLSLKSLFPWSSTKRGASSVKKVQSKSGKGGKDSSKRIRRDFSRRISKPNRRKAEDLCHDILPPGGLSKFNRKADELAGDIVQPRGKLTKQSSVQSDLASRISERKDPQDLNIQPKVTQSLQ